MPDIPLKNQAFDLTFHPTQTSIYVGLLTGEIKAFSYKSSATSADSNDGLTHTSTFSLRPTKRSCRGLAMSIDGGKLYRLVVLSTESLVGKVKV